MLDGWRQALHDAGFTEARIEEPFDNFSGTPREKNSHKHFRCMGVRRGSPGESVGEELGGNGGKLLVELEDAPVT